MATRTADRKTKTMADKIAELASKRTTLQLGGGKDRVDKQHAAGQTDSPGADRTTGGQKQLPGDRNLCPAPSNVFRHGGSGVSRGRSGDGLREY